MMTDTGNSDPVSQKPYPIAMKHYQWVKEEIEKLYSQLRSSTVADQAGWHQSS